MSKEPPKITENQGRFLVKLARKAITEYVATGKAIEPPPETEGELFRKSGVFVTLNRVEGERLRGCIGYPLPTDPLVVATIKASIAAATEDPRFEPVTLKEFESEIVVEVSVLTEPQALMPSSRLDLPNLVEIGKHGLIVSRGGYSGLLLPQVAPEWNWDAEEFLSNCCMKAGLSPDAWLVDGTQVQTFEAIIFDESSVNGPISMQKI
jgi:uncharacterized protein (TIGR00296 family)